MSWFSSIAGKAEALLNQLDEAAATSFQEAGIATPPKSPHPPTERETSPPPPKPGLSYEPVAQPTATPTSKRHQPLLIKSQLSSSSSSSWTPPIQSTWESSWSTPLAQSSLSKASPGGGCGQVTDESLMEYLNSPTSSRKENQTGNGGRKKGHQVKSGSSVAMERDMPSNRDMSHDALLEFPTGTDSRIETTPSTPPTSSPIAGTMPTSPVLKQPGGAEQTGQFVIQVKPVEDSSLVEMENHRLRQEVGGLGEELNQLRQKYNETNKVESELKNEIQSLRQQCSQLDQLVRRMRSQEDDLTSALEARDTQIHVLRNQLHESEGLIKSLKEKVEGAGKEKDRFLQDVSKSSEAHNLALLSLKSQLEQIQLSLSQSEESKNQLEMELVEREREWNKEREELTNTVYSQGRELQQQQIRYSETQNSLQTALQTSQKDYQQLQKDYNDYKQKAANILQSKDKIIQSLNSSEGTDGDVVHDTVLNELKTEKYHLQSQIVNNEQVILSLRTELQELEETHSIELDHLRQQIKLAEESLEEERNSHLSTQEELENTQKEIDQLKDNFVKEKTEMVGQLHEKDKIIKGLTAKVTSTSDQSDSGKRDLEQRLKELTEKLIDKQTNLEKLNIDRQSLQLQLERTQANLTELQRNRSVTSSSSSSMQNQTALQIETSPEDNTQLRPMASILPSSNTARQRHIQRVKTTLDSVDKIGLRIAWVLRRYPYIRLFMLIYILLLHVWVMVVLFTYKPEIHVD